MYRINVVLMPLVVIFGLLAGCDTTDANDEEPTKYDREIEELRRAMKPFHDFNAAQSAGYTVSIPDNPKECLDHPTLGAMGFHFGKLDLITNGDLSVTKPEVLIYEPQADGGLEFVGVEFVVPFSIRDEEESPPILFGKEFRQNERFQVWELHAWVGRDNPDGMHPDYNPAVSCEHEAKWQGKIRPEN